MQKEIISNGSVRLKDFPVAAPYTHRRRNPFPVNPDSLSAYLTIQENHPDDMRRLSTILQMDKIILELGCGSGSIAREIALKNPNIGVIATDQYDWTIPLCCGSRYQKTALAWKERRLEFQGHAMENLVLLRADLGILSHFPLNRVDTILLVNPEPKVGLAFMGLLRDETLYRKIKAGEKQIVILPFSKEMGVRCCGGYEFEHGDDWSQGLGFMMASGFDFHQGEPVQWLVDIVKSSPYSRSSTQKDVYVFGHPPHPPDSVKKSTGLMSNLKKFLESAKHLFTVRV